MTSMQYPIHLAIRVLGLLCLTTMLGCGVSPHDIAAQGDLDAMASALARNPAVIDARNRLGKTPLHYAVSFKQLEVMELLLRHDSDLDAADHTGMTPLHAAAMFGRASEARWLLEHGAQASPIDAFGDTPLHTAAIFGHGHIIQLLLAHGASLSAENADGLQALDLAYAHRRGKAARFIQYLLERKSN